MFNIQASLILLSQKRFLLGFFFKFLIVITAEKRKKYKNNSNMPYHIHYFYMQALWGWHRCWEKEFPICLGFFLYSQTLMSKLSAQCWSTDDEAVKGLELVSCLLPSVVLETFQSDAFPRKFTDFLALEWSLFLFLQVILPLLFLYLHCTKLVLFYGFLL